MNKQTKSFETSVFQGYCASPADSKTYGNPESMRHPSPSIQGAEQSREQLPQLPNQGCMSHVNSPGSSTRSNMKGESVAGLLASATCCKAQCQLHVLRPAPHIKGLRPAERTLRMPALLAWYLLQSSKNPAHLMVRLQAGHLESYPQTNTEWPAQNG